VFLVPVGYTACDYCFIYLRYRIFNCPIVFKRLWFELFQEKVQYKFGIIIIWAEIKAKQDGCGSCSVLLAELPLPVGNMTLPPRPFPAFSSEALIINHYFWYIHTRKTTLGKGCIEKKSPCQWWNHAKISWSNQQKVKSLAGQFHTEKSRTWWWKTFYIDFQECAL